MAARFPGGGPRSCMSQLAQVSRPAYSFACFFRNPYAASPHVGCASTGTCDPPAIVHSSTSTPLGHPPYALSLVSLPARSASKSNTTPSVASVPVHPFFAAHVAIVCASDGYGGCVPEGAPGATSPAATEPPPYLTTVSASPWMSS